MANCGDRKVSPRPVPLCNPGRLGVAGLGDSRYKLGSSWCISVCWVWAPAGWAGETKQWMVWGLQRWEKGGGQRRAWVAGDWLIALFGGGGLSATATATWGPLLKCFSSSLPPVISSISCCHQLIASQGPCISQTRSCLQISLCLHPEPGPVPLSSLRLWPLWPNLFLYFMGPSVKGPTEGCLWPLVLRLLV